jgi:hypothetical protein
MKNTIITVVVIIAVVIGAYFLFTNINKSNITNNETVATTTPVVPVVDNTQPATTTEVAPIVSTLINRDFSLGTTKNGNDIDVKEIGYGKNHILVIGGIHGSFSPNTITLVETLADYYEANPTLIPEDFIIDFIPTLNPDGVVANTRTNANGVDLNRNFDCDWKASAEYSGGKVSGGSKAFSEAESQALKSFTEQKRVDAVILYFASEAGGKVYAESCKNQFANETAGLTKAYSSGAEYAYSTTYTASNNTGEIGDWFATQNIPAISILLNDKVNTEFNKNLKGLEAVISYLE